MADDSEPDDRVSDATRAAEDAEAEVHGSADRAPTTDEEQRADEAAEDVDVAAVGEHFSEMDEIGAEVKGEGEIGG